MSVYQLYQRVLLFRFLCCKNSSKCNCMIMTWDIQYFMVLLLICSDITLLHFRSQIPPCFVGMLCFEYHEYCCIPELMQYCSLPVLHHLLLVLSLLSQRSFLNFHFLLTLSLSQQQQYPFSPPYSCFSLCALTNLRTCMWSVGMLVCSQVESCNTQ